MDGRFERFCPPILECKEGAIRSDREHITTMHYAPLKAPIGGGSWSSTG